jgi:hypothetical protein
MLSLDPDRGQSLSGVRHDETAARLKGLAMWPGAGRQSGSLLFKALQVGCDGWWLCFD